MNEKIIDVVRQPYDWLRKSDVGVYVSIGYKRGGDLFEGAWKEATEKGDKIPAQCAFEFGSIREVSRLALYYYAKYQYELDDCVARKNVPVFDAREWKKYV